MHLILEHGRSTCRWGDMDLCDTSGVGCSTTSSSDRGVKGDNPSSSTFVKFCLENRCMRSKRLRSKLNVESPGETAGVPAGKNSSDFMFKRRENRAKFKEICAFLRVRRFLARYQLDATNSQTEKKSERFKTNWAWVMENQRGKSKR